MLATSLVEFRPTSASASTSRRGASAPQELDREHGADVIGDRGELDDLGPNIAIYIELGLQLLGASPARSDALDVGARPARRVGAAEAARLDGRRRRHRSSSKDVVLTQPAEIPQRGTDAALPDLTRRGCLP
jgi:hypothetical protein